jgi:hypothetical protein
MLVKILGIIDIIAALLILFWVGAPFMIKIFFIIVLLVKGIPSLFADFIGKIYGIVDIITAIVFIFGVNLGVGSIILAAILMFKGLFSMP